MYEKHFNLNQLPFSIAPDPSFLYLSAAHSEALAHLMYGFSHGGFVMITGEVGTGKTTLLRNLLKQTPPDIDVAFILNPRLTVRELLETLCDELGVPYDSAAVSTVKQYIDLLTRHLLQTHTAGRSTVMIIDEAQNLSPAVLEQVRLLTNLETDERKLLRIILIGQPELSDLLDRQELRQLAQRITARYHLTSLNRPDSYAYVMHRLSRAGGNPHLFSPAALRRLYSLSRGIPRVINVIADRSLLGAYVEGNQQITARIVSRAAREVLGKRANHRRWLVTTAATVTIAGAAWAFLGTNPYPFGIRVGAISDSSMPSAMIEEQPAAEMAEAVESPPEIPERAVASTVRSSADTPNIEPIDDEIITPETYALNQKLRAAVEAEPSSGGIDSDVVRRPPGSAYLNRRLAYRAVFERWGVDFETLPNAPIPCDFAPSAGLQCLSRRGDWSEIVQLDLPVILELWDGEPAPFYAALTGLKDGRVELQIADRKLSATQRSLREFWSGAFVVLWQTPPGYYGSLREGQTHETIGWLRQQLATMTQRSLASSAPNRFDENLHEAVMKFQESEGLATDGVVGPATWIRLAERLQLPQPSLAG